VRVTVATRTLPADVEEFLLGAGVIVIDGEERPASDGGTFDAVDPATEEPTAAVPQATPDDVDAAVAAARRAFDDGRWRDLHPTQRVKTLLKVADLIERDAEPLAWVDMLDHGKPQKHAYAEMLSAAACFRYFAGWVDKMYGNTIPSAADRFIYSLREPVGVCGQIIPWNFPFLMAAWKVAPALAFGNTLVLKPAEQTPLSALWMFRLLAEAGVPPGVANLVQGVGEITGAALVAHPDVDKIAFTGSTEVGMAIMRASADHLHKVTLELGGKSPNIVFPDADIATVAKRAAFAIFYNAGEVCTAGSRLVVDAKIHDQLLDELRVASEKTTVGPGWDPDSRMGPVVNQKQYDRVESYVAIARAEGAELVTGGERADGFDRGFFYRPTVFDGVTPAMRIAQEEVFGPVLVVQTYEDEEEAIAIANSTPFGLASGVWTRDLGRAHRVARRLQAGTVWVNTWGEFSDSVSFGGYKQSGSGRELGADAIEAYTQTKHVWIAT